ncbi:N-(5'-phosphoribosyl)anthranilate isomerase [Streptomyces sp. NPDC051130]|uniref:phosphoribosylanthranilate isomerase n=1 Tax=Streptomyces sp. NPDC051130 TaxID=3157223 RepID=UPI00342AEA34
MSGPPPRTLLKVCGATTRGDIEAAATAGADCVGLWHGVPGGPRELDADTLADLASAARSAGLLPTLVTFLAEAEALTELARRTGVGWIQLHAYQSPTAVRALRASLAPEVAIVKVLHLAQGGAGCVERPLIGAYERAGTDLFLIDAATGDGRIGSTGRALDPADVLALLPRMTRPFLLAGGLGPTSPARYADVVRAPGFHGIDVDTAARSPLTGRFGVPEITALARAWRGDPSGGPARAHPPADLEPSR